MKLLILHLSDTHFREKSNYDYDVYNISRALSQMGKFDNCIIFYTGDIAQTGDIQEYIYAKRFLGKLVTEIKKEYINEYINICVIPGNHDINLKDYYTYDEIMEAYKKNNITELYDASQKRLDYFFDFANVNNCFRYRKDIEYRILNFDGFKIKVNFVNSAPLSLLKSENKDKGIHFLPEEAIALTNANKGENFCITMMHHGPEWFSEDCKKQLNSILLPKTDLLLLGHEHYSMGESRIINVEHKMSVSRGIALYNVEGECGFNAFILDTNTGSLFGNKYIRKDNYYSPVIILESDDLQLHKKGKYTWKSNFRGSLETDIGEREGDMIDNYFVFPTLRSKTFDDTQKRGAIYNEDQFIELLKDKKKISIEGGIKKGKTILAKHLCKILSDEFICIFLDERNFANDTSKIIRYQLNTQFENLSIDEYEQQKAENKILIIDNSDKISAKKWNDFYSTIRDNIDFIILLNSTNFNLDIKGKVIDSLMDETFYELKIEPFYYEKRLELINKICETKPSVSHNNIKEISRKINNEITNQIRFFNLTPDFIIQFVECFLSAETLIKRTKQENVFNKVYEANIVLRLDKEVEEDLVPDIMTALDFVASNVHFNKKYPFSSEDFISAINQYNEEYDNSLNARMVRDVSIKARIIREVPDAMTYEFCDNNLLAYFTACHIQRVLNEDEDTAGNILRTILDNIADDINGDILLFLSYLTDNTRVLNPIIACVEEHMGDWHEFDIDKKNIAYLSEIKDSTPVSVPTSKEKKKYAEKKGEIEKDIIENNESTSSELYIDNKDNEDEFLVKITKSINYLELISKILPGFSHILKGEAKNKIVNILYKYPNKLLYEMLEVIDEDHHKLIEEILKENPKTRQGELITESMIEKALLNQSIGYILSIYDFVSSTATTTKTLERFNKFDYMQNTNYQIQNLLMEENIGEFNSFMEKAESIYDNAEVDVVKRMVALIVRKFYLCHDDVPTIGRAQRVLDKMFLPESKKDFLLEQTRRKNTKK